MEGLWFSRTVAPAAEKVVSSSSIRRRHRTWLPSLRPAWLLVPVLLVAGPVRAQTNGGDEVVTARARPAEIALRAIEAKLARDPSNIDIALERIGALWLIGVTQEPAVDEALAALDSLAPRLAQGDTRTRARADALRGALFTLKAKHAFWPPEKLKHVRHGMRELDRAVEAAPRDPRVRYLRLVCGYYLPGFLGRGDEVRRDFEALASLLPGAADEFPPALYRSILRFVIAKGEIDPFRRANLERILKNG